MYFCDPGQFSDKRFAFLFKPGNHQVTANVGYYTSIIGLGASPRDTNIRDVIVQNGDFDYTGGALDNFWRSAENFYTKPRMTWNNNPTPAFMWAVSQACPIRRAYIDGNAFLWQYNYGCCAGYSSGGYLSNTIGKKTKIHKLKKFIIFMEYNPIVTGSISSGSQQQWFTRNCQGSWVGGNWNMVFVGNTPSFPSSHCSNNGGSPYTTVSKTPVIAEKPYMIIQV